MKRLAVILCFAALAALVAGCAQPAPEARFLSHWEKVFALVSDNQADPAKAEAAVKQYLKDNLADMQNLAKEFGKDKDMKIAKDPDFVSRVLAMVDKINALRTSHPGLFENEGLSAALAPLVDAAK